MKDPQSALIKGGGDEITFVFPFENLLCNYLYFYNMCEGGNVEGKRVKCKKEG